MLITQEFLKQVWKNYRDRELYAADLAAQETNIIIQTGHLEQEIKMRHMREAIESLIIDATGIFPEKL